MDPQMRIAIAKKVDLLKKAHDGTQQGERLADLVAQCTICIIETIVEENKDAECDS